MRILSLALFAGLALSLISGAEEARADDHGGGPKVLQVFALDVEAKDRAAVLGRLKGLQGILSNEGLPGFEVWLATYSGDSVGRLFLTVEQANHAAFGSNSMKVQSSAAIQKWVTDINNSGLAKVVSQSLLTDVTP